MLSDFLPERQEAPPEKPVVLAFGGMDPSGGAGLQADSEVLSYFGCHCAPVVTAVTIQDTQHVHRFIPLAAADVRAQAHMVLADMPVAAFKTGMLAHANTVRVIAELCAAHPHIPLICDPVLQAGQGDDLSVDTSSLITHLRQRLLPHTTILTPNTLEAQALTAQIDKTAAAACLLASGAKAVLITGTHAPTPAVEHWLYQTEQAPWHTTVPRLPGQFHGSGCTLTAAVSALVAHQNSIEDAVRHALAYTQRCLQHANHLGKGQAIPQRTLAHETI